VHFDSHHDFAAPGTRVVELMSDPEFQSHLELPDLSLPTVVAHEVDGTRRLLRLRYEYTGQLDSMARRIVGDRRLTWIQELQIDVATGAGTLTFSAEEDAGRVNGSAAVAVNPTGESSSHRTIAGDFRIRIPVIGGTAERKIVPGLVRRLDVEASAVAARLADDPAPD
jgi:hypothetical protein